MKLFSLILFAIGVILASVSMGIGQWSQLDTDRLDSSVMDGATFKSHSLLSRCISYELTREIIELGLTLDQQPQVESLVRGEGGRQEGGCLWCTHKVR